MLDLSKLAKQQQSCPDLFQSKIVPMVPGRVLAIDGDYLAYYASASPDTDPAFACKIAEGIILAMQSASGASKVLLCLTARGSWKGLRYLFAPKDYAYQDQRVGTHPKNWEVVRAYLENHPAAIETTFYEADDILRMCTRVFEDPVIATRDKDLRMCTGCYHLDWKALELTYVPKDAYCVQSVCDPDVFYGTKFFCYQLLVGDTADHILGLPYYMQGGRKIKIGKGRASNQLNDTETLDEGLKIVMDRFKSLPEDFWGDLYLFLAQQMSLLWIKEREGFEFEFLKEKYPRVYLACKRLHEEVYGEYRTIDSGPDSCLEGDPAIKAIREMSPLRLRDRAGESRS